MSSISFKVLNWDVIRRLKEDGDIELPYKKVSGLKDERWNTKQMTSKVLRGILNGDSVQKIAKAMESCVGNNENSAIRNARTMFTSAENNGRLDSYKNLTDQGVVMKKEWEATPDDRTRPSHKDIDGEEQDIDKSFSNGCMFPGDGNGPAEEVWCCRCAMGSHFIGFRRDDGSISRINDFTSKASIEEQVNAIHQYQQVSHEGITQKEREAIYDYINTHDDFYDSASRGLTVQQSTIDKWIEDGEISMNGMTSWSADGSVSSRFAQVTRAVDAEDGKRSVLIVSENGLPNSALLPRTNAYSESEILTLCKEYDIVNYRVDKVFDRENKSPTLTIIFVKPKH